MSAEQLKWGETVRIAQGAPGEYRPGTWGSICGMRHIDAVDVSEMFKSEIGSLLFIVEFGDGFSTEIPERYLERNEK